MQRAGLYHTKVGTYGYKTVPMLIYARYDGADHPVAAARNELVGKVKAMIAGRFGSVLSGKMFSLLHGAVELKDTSALGDYHLENGSVLDVIITTPQPYSVTDYSKMAAKLEADGIKKPASTYYNPGEWKGEWTKGDEYLSYPPVDVNNKWSAVAPSTSTDLTLSPKGGRKENGAKPQSMGPGRLLSQKYVCNVRGAQFHAFHMMEGAWSGRLDAFGTSSPTAVREHACHSNMSFSPSSMTWVEEQTITTSDGLSSKMKFRYAPVDDGVLRAECDASDLAECVLRVREDTTGIITITAVRNGAIAMVETITVNEDCSKRVRLRQMYSKGGLVLVYVFHEAKFVDENTGQLEPLNL